MKLAAKYKKPTIVARLNDQGYDRGSMRGMNQSELTSFKDFLMGSGYFEYVAGHDNAAGASILDKHLADFHAYANEQLKNIDFGENFYDVNFIRNSGDADIADIVLDLDKYNGIYGQGNPEPLINVKNIKVRPENITVMGAKKDTIKIFVDGIAYMKFLSKDWADELLANPSNFTMEIVGKPNANHWGGRVTPQIFIEDFEIKQDTILEF